MKVGRSCCLIGLLNAKVVQNRSSCYLARNLGRSMENVKGQKSDAIHPVMKVIYDHSL